MLAAPPGSVRFGSAVSPTEYVLDSSRENVAESNTFSKIESNNGEFLGIPYKWCGRFAKIKDFSDINPCLV